jgi:hypothetical protein
MGNNVNDLGYWKKPCKLEPSLVWWLSIVVHRDTKIHAGPAFTYIKTALEWNANVPMDSKESLVIQFC